VCVNLNPKMRPDCSFFLRGQCRHGDQCRFRHAPELIEKGGLSAPVCARWSPDPRVNGCANFDCPRQHPAAPAEQCRYENTPRGCTNPGCLYTHTGRGPGCGAVPPPPQEPCWKQYQ
jgi:hypothetical protein